ncbi:MAG: GNAT family N-acetyltransferase [Clostridia bacterium]|nr:GNAT family N-acetyltransferase [Clostridia bacterium]
MLNKIDKSDYYRYIPLAKAHDSGKIYPQAIAENIQYGDIYEDKNAVLFHAYGGFAYVAGEMNEDFLSEVYSMMTDENRSRRFILLTRDENIHSYFALKDNISIEKRYLYQYFSDSGIEISLADSCEIKEMDKNILENLSGRIIPSLFWQNTDEFIEKGKGYCVMQGNEIAAWAFSASVSCEEIDIGLETAEKYRGQGLATVAAKMMMKYTQEQGKAPVWACYYKNMASQKIAEKLGFSKTAECYIIKSAQ